MSSQLSNKVDQNPRGSAFERKFRAAAIAIVVAVARNVTNEPETVEFDAGVVADVSDLLRVFIADIQRDLEHTA